MKKVTLQLVDDSVYYCLVNPINDCGIKEFNGGKKLDVNESAEYCYKELLVMSEDTFGYSKAVRFDGKKNIINHLKKRIVEIFELEEMSEYIEKNLS